MSFSEPVREYFRDFRDTALHYPVLPEEVVAWVTAGGVPNTIEDGRLRKRPVTNDAGEIDIYRQESEYQMVTEDVVTMVVKRKHTIEVDSVFYELQQSAERNGRTFWKLERVK